MSFTTKGLAASLFQQGAKDWSGENGQQPLLWQTLNIPEVTATGKLLLGLYWCPRGWGLTIKERSQHLNSGLCSNLAYTWKQLSEATWKVRGKKSSLGNTQVCAVGVCDNWDEPVLGLNICHSPQAQHLHGQDSVGGDGQGLFTCRRRFLFFGLFWGRKLGKTGWDWME